MAEPRNRYSTVSLNLHRLVAAQESTEGPISRECVQIHKSVGLSILVLTLGRLGWCLANPAIPQQPAMRAWEKGLARATQVLSYAFMIGMPLVGWAASPAGGRDIQWFSLPRATAAHRRRP